LKPLGPAAFNNAPIALTRRSSETLPMPLPINSMADARNAAPGQGYVRALTLYAKIC